MTYIYNISQIAKRNFENFHAKPFLVIGEESYTFNQVWVASQKIINYIGTDKNKIKSIGIFNDKNFLEYAAILACLRIGVPYFCIDKDIPRDRLIHIFESASPDYIFYSKDLQCNFELNNWSKKYCDLDDILMPDKYQNIMPDDNLILDINPVYIMFTSGSTGKPKGVIVSHSNLLNFLGWCKEEFNFTDKDVFSNLNPMYFDNSIFDFYNAIYNGCTLVVVKKEMLLRPHETLKYLDSNGCTTWFSVPSLLRYFDTVKAFDLIQVPKIKRIIFAGEPYPIDKLMSLYNKLNSKTKLYNCYGPTETTCLCSANLVEGKHFKNQLLKYVPLGKKLASNVDFLIKDGDIFYSSDTKNIRGELIILGSFVSLGYLDKTLNNRSFIKVEEKNGITGYCTGDIVHIDENGDIHFTSRNDSQIKYMGYRIELSDIEKNILQIENVSDCVVLFNESTYPGKIIAHVATSHSESDIKKILINKLPNYMVPKKIIKYDHLPKNANGKIDKNVLKENNG